jgi:hypothetical protein
LAHHDGRARRGSQSIGGSEKKACALAMRLQAEYARVRVLAQGARRTDEQPQERWSVRGVRDVVMRLTDRGVNNRIVSSAQLWKPAAAAGRRRLLTCLNVSILTRGRQEH